jgi:hypothetical protein
VRKRGRFDHADDLKLEPAVIFSCEPLTVEIYVLLPGVKPVAVRGYHRQIIAASQRGK